MGFINVLLVDDEERFLATTKILLTKRGLNPETAASGQDALAIMAARPIDVAILDLKMPGLDGIELMRRIKKLWPLVEIIILTGHASVETAVEGLKLGASDYVMKPCDVTDLLAKVHRAAEKKIAAEDRLLKDRVEDLISHPLAVFKKD